MASIARTLKGGTLGFYLLFDNTRHIATSVYLLNQEPLTRRFQTIEQYRDLRTRFLATYTGCIAQNPVAAYACGKGWTMKQICRSPVCCFSPARHPCDHAEHKRHPAQQSPVATEKLQVPPPTSIDSS